MNIINRFEPFQVLTILFCLLMIANAISQYRRKKRSKRELVAWLLVWGSLGAIGAYPQTVDIIGRYLGMKSGANTIFLLAIIVLAYITLRHIFLIESLDEKITKLTQKLAIEKFKDESEDGE